MPAGAEVKYWRIPGNKIGKVDRSGGLSTHTQELSIERELKATFKLSLHLKMANQKNTSS